MSSKLGQSDRGSSADSKSYSGSNWSAVLERSGKGRKSDEVSSDPDMNFSWVSTSWGFRRSDPHEGTLRVGLGQGRIATPGSKQVVSGICPFDLHQGKKEKSLATLRS